VKILLWAALLCSLSAPAAAQFTIDQSEQGPQQDAEVTYLKDLAVGDKAYFRIYATLFCETNDHTIIAFSNAELGDKSDLDYAGGYLLTILPKGEVSVKFIPGPTGDKRTQLKAFASSLLRAPCESYWKIGYDNPGEGLPVHDVEGANSYLELKKLILNGNRQ
jgi:hypothetical protein